MKRKKSLGFNGLLNGVRSALNLVFPLITFPYITRVLSVGSVGAYNFSNTYVGYFILLAGLGISTYAVREGAKYRDNREKLSKFASEIFALNPARDFAPRLAYSILPIPNKGAANWSYAWVPILGPICGGLLAVFLKTLI